MVTRKEICDNIRLSNDLFNKYFHTVKDCKDGRKIIEVFEEEDGNTTIYRFEIEVKQLKTIN